MKGSTSCRSPYQLCNHPLPCRQAWIKHKAPTFIWLYQAASNWGFWKARGGQCLGWWSSKKVWLPFSPLQQAAEPQNHSRQPQEPWQPVLRKSSVLSPKLQVSVQGQGPCITSLQHCAPSGGWGQLPGRGEVIPVSKREWNKIVPNN